MYGAARAKVLRFQAGDTGQWSIECVAAVKGGTLAPAARLAVESSLSGSMSSDRGAVWTLTGFVSNARYSTAAELKRMSSVSPQLGRPEATCAALIPIKKTPAWWALGQDERRAIFEERSGHIRKAMNYVPEVARQLHHSRDLGEPFDFLTWFEFAPEHQAAFDAMLAELRATEEWHYVEREVDVRLSRLT